MFKSYEVKKNTGRITNVRVLDVDLALGKITVWHKKHEPGRVLDKITTFFVTKDAQIKDVYGRALQLSNIKPDSRVSVDYVKESDCRLIASYLVVAVK